MLITKRKEPRSFQRGTNFCKKWGRNCAPGVLAQLICASAAERNWSVYGAIKTASRSRMGHGVADKLVYCHEALHLKAKLQKASYHQMAEVGFRLRLR